MTEQLNMSEITKSEGWIIDQDVFGNQYISDGMPTTFDPFDVYRNGEKGDPYACLANDKWDEWSIWGASIAPAATESGEQLEDIMDRLFDELIDAELAPYNQGDGDEGFWDAELETYEELSDDETLRMLRGTDTNNEGEQ